MAISAHLLVISERAQMSASLGESHFREFKSGLHGPPDKKTKRQVTDICRDIASTLVAFANADGGELRFASRRTENARTREYAARFSNRRQNHRRWKDRSIFFHSKEHDISARYVGWQMSAQEGLGDRTSPTEAD